MNVCVTTQLLHPSLIGIQPWNIATVPILHGDTQESQGDAHVCMCVKVSDVARSTRAYVTVTRYHRALGWKQELLSVTATGSAGVHTGGSD